jgi:hypothetical protein
MTRDWKADRGKKHVHFDTPDNTNPGKSSKKKGSQECKASSKLQTGDIVEVGVRVEVRIRVWV